MIDQAAVWLAREGCKGTVDLASVAESNRRQLQPKRRRHRLDGAQLTDPGGLSTDIALRGWDRRKVPFPDSCSATISHLFDHLVGGE